LNSQWEPGSATTIQGERESKGKRQTEQESKRKMTVQRVSSVRGTNYTSARPFSTNNPFRNASFDSNIGTRSTSQNSDQQQHFNSWVQRNHSQLSFSSDDEDSDLFKVPQPIRPSYQRTHSNSSVGSAGSRNIP